ncbi:pyruvate, phosphate dikinase [Candidatus Woesearchaeota archaeon]|nr:pyruvate, phosphate dikinase [Candidatus Woesearchaeota archaeon]
MNEQTWVYYCRDKFPDDLEAKVMLGGKGANLRDMFGMELPVPPFFTITTEACVKYMGSRELPEYLWEQALEALAKIEKETGKKLGDSENPLLLSVRSGARKSMPGMMDTVLNLGMNDDARAALAELTGNEWFSYDSYRRFIMMFSDVVMHYSREAFEEKLEEIKTKEKVRRDQDISLEGMKWLVDEFKAMYKGHFGEDFPTDPKKQLELAIKAVFDSWNGVRAKAYREHEGIPHDWGTAVNVQAMVFGNMGDNSATGVGFTRSPANGDNRHPVYAEVLFNAQGEDVVAGIRTPQRASIDHSREWAANNDISETLRERNYPSLEEAMPGIYQELVYYAGRLEEHYRDMQDFEFTIENGRLWMLQTRTGKRTAGAAVKIAVDLANEALISKEEAIMRVLPEYVDLLLRPSFDLQAEKTLIAKGLAASPGAAVGYVVFDPEEAKQLAKEGRKVILVRQNTSPDDVDAMAASKGVLTQKGGMTSHAAVVARGYNLPCVAGAEEISVDYVNQQFSVDGLVIHKGDLISIDGFTGNVYKGDVPLIDADYHKQENLITLLEWADEIRTLGVRANADYPADARKAVEFGAEGIGLERTEHMFFNPEARAAVVGMIMAQDDKERQEYLDIMQPIQEQHFEGVFEAMNGLPVIMRLIDPPMHEFLPPYEKLLEEVINLRYSDPASQALAEKEKMLEVVNNLRETNPMMGLRGCRAGIMYKGLTEMQTRAYFQAACRCTKRGINVTPEVMIPLVSHVNELKMEREKLEDVAKQVMQEEGIEVKYKFGTMIEVPRAAVTAGEIAGYADFFSFGTNDLTQMSFGYSRDDAEGKFLIKYIEGFNTGKVDDEGNPLLEPILEANPFQTLDQKGVGRLIQMAVEDGLAAKPDLDIGICGEHGGDPTSIDFCHRIGLDYVSCSPFRIPVARLAAAQAKIRNDPQYQA